MYKNGDQHNPRELSPEESAHYLIPPKFGPKPDFFCPNLHTLVCNYTYSNGTCDTCSVNIVARVNGRRIGTEIMECKECNYWMCMKCAKEKE